MPITGFHAAQTMQAFMKRKGWTKVGVIYRNDDYGDTGLGHFQDAGKRARFNVVDASDRRQCDRRDNAADGTLRPRPQAIVAWTSLTSAAVIVKRLGSSACRRPLLYSMEQRPACFSPKSARRSTAPIRLDQDQCRACHVQERSARKFLDHCIASFTQLYPKDAPVSIFGGFGYDGVYMPARVIKDANSTNAVVPDSDFWERCAAIFARTGGPSDLGASRRR